MKFSFFRMKVIGLHYTGAALCFLLFSATGAQNLSILNIIQGLQSEAQVYPTPLYSFSLCMEINNRIFNDSLLNTASLYYKNMYTEVTNVLDMAFNCPTCSTKDSYRGVNSMHFSKGSVIANCTIQFQTIFINNVVIKHLFLNAIENKTLPNGMIINGQYTNETVTPKWLFQPSTTTSGSASFYSGSGTFWLPGWAIALLVLACICIVLLIIILVLICCCWCCRRKEKKEETPTPTTVTPYERTSFKEHLANPTYMSHTPERNPNYPTFGEPGIQHGNQNGIYMMNPQR
ncbi:uncharacterized protein si:dkeyp-92c9.4 [Danio rerio]|uniref:Mucin-1 n=12 Tax=Danio rerio TaxID=7955 RepID=A0A0R4IZ38_DANRE|nr:mucin-1-like [Danio rerio]|eukprot:XP_003200649.2 mucin-1-like [Danio rerio]